MNWKQLFASANPEEKLDGLIYLHRRVARYKRRWIVARGRIFRNRREVHRKLHYLHDRRSPHPQWKRAVRNLTRHVTIAFIIATLITGVVLFAINVERHIGIPTILAFEIALVIIMYVPRRYRFRSNGGKL